METEIRLVLEIANVLRERAARRGDSVGRLRNSRGGRRVSGGQVQRRLPASLYLLLEMEEEFERLVGPFIRKWEQIVGEPPGS